ncbi:MULTISPECIES: hypothetical protein [Limnospira]|uniref:hypothetical protein n=1 Tax=Limnospira TaxID=2596745 RepID=UPI000280447A|nr:hypothetical protein SPLC1_S032310 [Arthrospira platensis C1]QJB27580.1 hypothetical protein HFV01_19505 [Limnospira fusiformis SAG 85.79]UWU49971.1 hypothetical protein APLC1_4851 [Arthrospira platensis C1]
MMLKVRFLTISAFAAGFGLCSIVFALFTVVAELSLAAAIRTILTSLFFGINMVFMLHYYTSIYKEQKLISRLRAEVKNMNYINYN